MWATIQRLITTIAIAMTFIFLVVLLWSLLSFVPPNYGKIQYPAWGLALGWCMVLFVLMWIPLVTAYKLMRAEGSLWQRARSLCVPSEDWHPYLEIYRGERYSEENRSQRRAVSTNNKSM